MSKSNRPPLWKIVRVYPGPAPRAAERVAHSLTQRDACEQARRMNADMVDRAQCRTPEGLAFAWYEAQPMTLRERWYVEQNTR